MKNEYIYIGIPVINGEIDGDAVLLKSSEVFEYFDNNECIIIRINLLKNTVDYVNNFSI